MRLFLFLCFACAIITTPPIQDADDEANLGAATGLLKWFHDVEHDAGQTFTPSANLMLNSYTFQVGRKNDNDHADEWLKFRLGTIDRSGGFDFVDIYEEEAHWDMDWAQGDYVTITLDTPQALAGGVEYGVIQDAQQMGNWNGPGIPYLNENADSSYAGGNAIGRGGQRSRDLIFHTNLTAATGGGGGVPEPATATLALLGLGGLMMRRRRNA